MFTRFITPQRPEDRRGQWQTYYSKWQRATREQLAFFGSRLGHMLVEKHVGTVVVTGAETYVCVLSTVLSAVDLGFRVVIVEDALCSSSDPGHDALMTMYRVRFHEQIELVRAEELFDMWRPD